jgi:hypothetical protein
MIGATRAQVLASRRDTTRVGITHFGGLTERRRQEDDVQQQASNNNRRAQHACRPGGSASTTPIARKVMKPLVELPDDVGPDIARGCQDPKEIPTRRWSERVRETSRILPKHRAANVSASRPPPELADQLLDRHEVESEGRAVTRCGAPVFANVYGARGLEGYGGRGPQSLPVAGCFVLMTRV